MNAGEISIGCPAHVGIDPSLGSPCLPMLRLPRTRGDRPIHARIDKYADEAAPHTWG